RRFGDRTASGSGGWEAVAARHRCEDAMSSSLKNGAAAIQSLTTRPLVAQITAMPLGPVAILGVLVIVFTISQPTFFGVRSFQAIGVNAAIVFIFAVGETFVILTG